MAGAEHNINRKKENYEAKRRHKTKQKKRGHVASTITNKQATQKKHFEKKLKRRAEKKAIKKAIMDVDDEWPY